MIKYKSKIKFLNKEKEIELFTQYQKSKSEKLKNEIVENYASLVFSYAKKMCHTPTHYEDLVQEGFVGLVMAIDRFDLSCECRFLHYANFWVKAKIYNFILENSFLVSSPETASFKKGFWSFNKVKHLSDEEICNKFKMKPEEMNMLRTAMSKSNTIYLDAPLLKNSDNQNLTNSNKILDNMSVTTFETDFVNKQEDKFRLEQVNSSLERLKPKERDVILKYYMEEKTLDKIGKEYDLTRQAIDLIRRKSIAKIQRYLDVEVI